METIMCSHSVHQVSDLKKTQYDIALAVIGSLMEDCLQAQRVVEEAAAAPVGSVFYDRYAQGKAAAYDVMLGNLLEWRDVLKKE